MTRRIHRENKSGELFRGRAIVKIPERTYKYPDWRGQAPVRQAATTAEIDCGPYSTVGAATAVTGKEINSETRHLTSGAYDLHGEIEIERWVEKAETTWTRIAD